MNESRAIQEKTWLVYDYVQNVKNITGGIDATVLLTSKESQFGLIDDIISRLERIKALVEEVR